MCLEWSVCVDESSRVSVWIYTLRVKSGGGHLYGVCAPSEGRRLRQRQGDKDTFLRMD